MPSILNRVSDGGDSSSDEYTRVGEEERKPLNDYHDEAENDVQTAAEIYALKRTIKRTNLYLKVLIGLLSVTILALLSLQGPSAYKTIREVKGIPEEASKDKFRESLKPKPLIKTPVPEIPMAKVVFQEDKKYSGRPNSETDAAWDALLPDGRGFVFIDNWKDYDLPPGEETAWGMIYSVAVFHQMHCLGQIRRLSWMFLDAITKNDTEQQDAIKLMFSTNFSNSHLDHCFDYLRQTITCGGDMTMEWPRTEKDGTTRVAVDGWGIPHECKNWDYIMEYMDTNHFNMSTNSQIAPLDNAAQADFRLHGLKLKQEEEEKAKAKAAKEKAGGRKV